MEKHFWQGIKEKGQVNLVKIWIAVLKNIDENDGYNSNSVVLMIVVTAMIIIV